MGFELLVVEDDEDLAEALAAELRDLGHRTTIAQDGRAALRAVEDAEFDAVVLDRMLPNVDGIAVLRQLRATMLTVPVLMLSARGNLAEKVEGLEAGADDYIVKPVPVSEIDARLHALVRGRKWTSERGDTMRVGDLTISPAKFRAWRNDTPLELGKLEFNLLAELARNAGTVVTRDMLIERVWKYDFAPGSNIVEVHIRRLRGKLTAGGGDDPIATVRGVGYMLRE